MIDRQKPADAKDWAEGQRKGAPNFHAVTLLDALAKAEAKHDRLREALEKIRDYAELTAPDMRLNALLRIEEIVDTALQEDRDD